MPSEKRFQIFTVVKISLIVCCCTVF